MAINMGTMGISSTGGTNNILNLQKNDILDLTKREPGLTKVTLGAGWDVAATGQDFDLDISAFLLNENGKIEASSVMQQVVFFNNMAVCVDDLVLIQPFLCLFAGRTFRIFNKQHGISSVSFLLITQSVCYYPAFVNRIFAGQIRVFAVGIIKEQDSDM